MRWESLVSRVRPFRNNKYNVILVYFVSCNFSIFFSSPQWITNEGADIHRCNSLSQNVRVSVTWCLGIIGQSVCSGIRQWRRRRSILSPWALSVRAPRGWWKRIIIIIIYNIIHICVFITFIIFVCSVEVLQCTYTIFFISHVLRVLSVPAVAFPPLQAHGSRPTTTYASIQLRL